MKTLRRLAALLLSLLLAGGMAASAGADGEEKGRPVRVGWHQAPYFIKDQYGRRSGYSYEYQWKVAAYTG